MESEVSWLISLGEFRGLSGFSSSFALSLIFDAFTAPGDRLRERLLKCTFGRALLEAVRRAVLDFGLGRAGSGFGAVTPLSADSSSAFEGDTEEVGFVVLGPG